MQSKILRRYYRYRNLLMCRMQKDLLANNDKTIVTIFHDYEGKYAVPEKEDESLLTVNKILEIEARYNIKGTYNTVAKLAEDLPQVVENIIENGHEVASHSFEHRLYTEMSQAEQGEQIEKATSIFNDLGLSIVGHRCPQSAWTPTVITKLLTQNYRWVAENGTEPYPYICARNKVNSLWRFPVSGDDWAYQSLGFTPDEMLSYWKQLINDGIKNNRYTAIGMHPWVQAAPERLEMLNDFFSWLSTLPQIDILPFGQVVELLESY